MKISRRQFVSSSCSLVLAGAIPRMSKAIPKEKKNLVIIMLRGAMDGLTAVPLTSDQYLEEARPDILVNNLKRLDQNFSLHPKLSTFYRLWQNNTAAVVHATSIPYTGRSHFDGQNLMESGGRVPYADKTGWLGRGIDEAGYEGLAISLPVPLLLRSKNNPNNYFPAKWPLPEREIIELVGDTYKNEPDLFRAFQKIKTRPISMMIPSRARKAHELAEVAGGQLSLPNGPRVAVFELNGFDTHAAQGGSDGEHGERLGEFDRVLDALEANMGKHFENTLVLTLTEFGRTLNQNGGYGTEHGYGTAILMAGGLIKMAQVFSDWPGLKEKNLFEGRDLKATIDARSIYCSALANCFHLDFDLVRRKVFWNENLTDLSSTLFKN